MDLPYRMAFLAALLSVVAAGKVLSRRYGRPANDVPRSADGWAIAATLVVGGLVFWGGLLAWVAWPPALTWSAMGLPPAVRWAGLPLLLAGAALAMWARFTLGKSSTLTSVPAPDAELVTDGPYRWFRHPIYSGGAVMLAGAAALSDSGLILAIGVLMLGVLGYRTRREERLLLERYGSAYRAHMERTGRWLPRVTNRR